MPELPPRADRDDMLARYGEDSWHTVEAAAAAEAQGDADRALQLHLAGPHVPGSLREQMLREVALLADAAPAWVHARWIAKQAYRWLLLSDDPRPREALQMTGDALYADVDPERPLGWEPRDFVDQVIAADWVCAQLATYDLGGMEAFLAERAGPALAARAGGAAGWPLAAMSGYRLVELQADQLGVVDLLTSRPVRLLNVGAAWARDADTCVIGRLASTGTEPGLMFESRPLTVDDTTALQVARAAALGRTTWLNVLAEARAAGRLEAGFSLCMPTSLVCDLPGGPPSGVTGAGESAVDLCDLVLDAVQEDPAEAGFMAPVLFGVLLEPDSLAAIRESCTQAARRQAWLALAAACCSPFGKRCAGLADACGWRPAA
jgi:hypothetical protein